MSDPVTISPALLAAYKNLYLTARMFLELAEPISEDETFVNTDNVENLNTAYQEVYQQLNKRKS